MPIIQTDRLCHCFADGTRSLDDVSLTFAEGDFTVIAGANGSGKTTLLKHFNGLLFPQSGTVSVCGKSVKKDPFAARQQVGMVFQDADSQIIGDTVYDDVAFGPENLRLNQTQIAERVSRSLFDVNLVGFEDKSPHNLSGGEKRRLAIAGVLAMAPRVLVMDEPFSNLDYPGIRQVLEQILSLHASGHTVLIATHDLEDVIVCADRLVLMKDGKVIKNGRPAALTGALVQLGMREPRTVCSEMGI